MPEVIKYMDSGGSLFLAGQDLARGISRGQHPEFLSEYLGSEFTASRINLFQLSGIDGEHLGDGLDLNIQGEGNGVCRKRWDVHKTVSAR